MFNRKKTVANVMAQFNKTIAELGEVFEAQMKAADNEQVKAADLRSQARDAEVRSGNAHAEAIKADRTIDKLRALTEG